MRAALCFTLKSAVLGVLDNVVASAVRAVRSALPELVKKMTADGVTGDVVFSSSVDSGTEPASFSGATEARRITARAADFPGLSVSSLVEIDGAKHVVTSLTEIGGAAFLIGLSNDLAETRVAYFGTRREGSRVRELSGTFPALIVEDADLEGAYADGVAMNGDRLWRVVIRAKDWTEETRPEVGDNLKYDDERGEHSLNVAVVSVHSGYFVLSAREA